MRRPVLRSSAVPPRRFVLRTGGREVRLKVHKCHLDGGPPGNSRAALDACLDAGVDAMEVDVCALTDGEFLVTHGPDLAHETTGRGVAGLLDAAAARGLRLVAQGRASEYRVPLLSELLPELRGSGRLQLDLKDERMPATALDALARQIEGYADHLIVGGGCASSLRGLRERLPGLALGFDPLLLFDLRQGAYAGPFVPARVDPTGLEEAFERLWREAPAAEIWYLRAALIARLADDDFDAIGWLGGRGVEVDAWTIDVQPGPGKRQWSVDLLRRVVALGAAQVTTNTPLAWLALAEQSAL
jgi:glycerophosphoryl diester phosphodiesterase